jgi:hypothetical protein
VTLCAVCQEPLPLRKPGPGRPRTYCSVTCRMEAQRRVYKAKVDEAERLRKEEYRRKWGHAQTDLDAFGRLKR